MSGKDLADAVGLSKGALCNVEHGRHGVSELTLVRLAQRLDVTVTELIL